MTLDEAIKHAEEVAEEKEEQAWEAQLQEEYITCKDCAKEHRQLAEWLKELKQLREQTKTGRWIPCSERLPEERDWYLAVFEEVDTGFIGVPYIADYLMGTHTIYTTEDGWIIHNCTDIEGGASEYYKKLRCVAWQPLPEPYKAESEVEKNDIG